MPELEIRLVDELNFNQSLLKLNVKKKNTGEELFSI